MEIKANNYRPNEILKFIRQNSNLTQEELAKYGIGTTEGLPSQELDAENHNSWILALHNENGILDWMISHQKNKEKC